MTSVAPSTGVRVTSIHSFPSMNNSIVSTRCNCRAASLARARTNSFSIQKVSHMRSPPPLLGSLDHAPIGLDTLCSFSQPQHVSNFLAAPPGSTPIRDPAGCRYVSLPWCRRQALGRTRTGQSGGCQRLEYSGNVHRRCKRARTCCCGVDASAILAVSGRPEQKSWLSGSTVFQIEDTLRSVEVEVFFDKK